MEAFDWVVQALTTRESDRRSYARQNEARVDFDTEKQYKGAEEARIVSFNSDGTHS